MDDAALELIRREGVFGLGGYDGCLCTSFRVRGIDVDISCRKSSGGLDGTIEPTFYGTTVRVYARSGDVGGDALRAIAEEIASQLRAGGSGEAIAVRYCDYTHDKDGKCIYCGRDRAEPADYLCRACKTGINPLGQLIAEVHDPSRFQFRLEEPTF